MTQVLTFLGRIKATDVVGMAFAGVAIYGMATGRVPAQDVTGAVALAGAYLGVKIRDASSPPSIGSGR